MRLTFRRCQSFQWEEAPRASATVCKQGLHGCTASTEIKENGESPPEDLPAVSSIAMVWYHLLFLHDGSWKEEWNLLLQALLAHLLASFPALQWLIWHMISHLPPLIDLAGSSQLTALSDSFGKQHGTQQFPSGTNRGQQISSSVSAAHVYLQPDTEPRSESHPIIWDAESREPCYTSSPLETGHRPDTAW